VEDRSSFWVRYYREIVARKTPWLDYSNERVQAQTFGLCLEAAGPVIGRRCLDIGCGWGHFSLSLAALQAAEVTGIDAMEELVAELRKKHPHVRWTTGDVQDRTFRESLGAFDLVFLLEVLQYMPIRDTIHGLWESLAPGGRIVAMVPNRECPIIQGAVARFEGRYAPPSPAEIVAVLASLPEHAYWEYRGLRFQEDQRHLPYAVSPWTRSILWDAPPNRLLIVAEKAVEKAAERKKKEG